MKNKDFNNLKRTRREFLATQRLLKQWNKRLANEGVSVEAGKSSRLVYVGGTEDLGVIEKYQKLGTK